MITNRYIVILIWLLIVSASIYLLERLFVLIGLFATPILLFGIGWLFALVLRPAVDRLVGVEVPLPYARRQGPWHLPRVVAVFLVYGALLAVLATLIVVLVPVVVPQVTNLSTTLSDATTEISIWATNLEALLQQRGFRGDLSAVIRPEALAQQATTLGSSLVQQSVTIASGLANLMLNLALVLIISFYMTLDGPRINEQALELLPLQWRGPANELSDIVDRTFGGFLRAQLVQSLIYGCANAVLMIALGLPDVALVSALAGVLVFVPLIGGFFAVVPPILVALIQNPGQLLPLIVGLIIMQQIVFNILMPRLMGKIVGLHPLLIFAAILIGAAVAGGWGILFGIPIAGVLAAVLQFLHLRVTKAPATVPDP